MRETFLWGLLIIAVTCVILVTARLIIKLLIQARVCFPKYLLLINGQIIEKHYKDIRGKRAKHAIMRIGKCVYVQLCMYKNSSDYKEVLTLGAEEDSIVTVYYWVPVIASSACLSELKDYSKE